MKAKQQAQSCELDHANVRIVKVVTMQQILITHKCTIAKPSRPISIFDTFLPTRRMLNGDT